MRTAILTLLLVLAALLMGAGLLYSGAYNVAADEPHWAGTARVLEWARERSIAAHSRDIEVPDLADPALVRAGAVDYEEMCAMCHMRPGVQETELSVGLHPRPPNLTLAAHQSSRGEDQRAREKVSARRFWIIKHGIKMSGMPAWGPTHDERRIWAMVAFLETLPDLAPEEYARATRANGAGAHGHDHSGHVH